MFFSNPKLTLAFTIVERLDAPIIEQGHVLVLHFPDLEPTASKCTCQGLKISQVKYMSLQPLQTGKCQMKIAFSSDFV